MNDKPKRQISAKQRAVLDRARIKAQENRRKKIDAEAWAYVEPKITIHNCTCKLRANMSLTDLRKLGAGCTDPAYCCPVLAVYRRYLEDPSAMKAKEK